MAERQGRTTPSASSSIVEDSNSRYTIVTRKADLPYIPYRAFLYLSIYLSIYSAANILPGVDIRCHARYVS